MIEIGVGIKMKMKKRGRERITNGMIEVVSKFDKSKRGRKVCNVAIKKTIEFDMSERRMKRRERSFFDLPRSITFEWVVMPPEKNKKR